MLIHRSVRVTNAALLTHFADLALQAAERHYRSVSAARRRKIDQAYGMETADEVRAMIQVLFPDRPLVKRFRFLDLEARRQDGDGIDYECFAWIPGMQTAHWLLNCAAIELADECEAEDAAPSAKGQRNVVRICRDFLEEWASMPQANGLKLLDRLKDITGRDLLPASCKFWRKRVVKVAELRG